jgi:hypothetical protein
MKTQDFFKTTSKQINENIEKTFGKKLNLETFSLDQLQDARNKLRTQVSQVRGQSGFNENLENDAFHQAQWMLDAINAEIAERDEHIIESDVEEGEEEDVPPEVEAAIEKFLATNPKNGDDLQAFHHKAISDKNKDLDDYLTFLYDYVADQTGAGGTEELGVYDEMLDMLHQMMADKGWSEGVEENAMKDVDHDLRMIANDGDEDELISALQGDMGSGVADVLNDMMSELQDELAAKGMNDVINDNDKMIEMLWDKLVDEYGGDGWDGDDDIDSSDADADALKSAGFGSDEDYESIQNEKAPGYVSRGVGSVAGAVGGVGGALLGSMFWGLLGPIGIGAGAVGGTVGGYKVGSETADAVWDKVTELLGSDKKATEFGVAHAKAAKAGETSFEFGGKEYDVTLKPQEVGKAVADLKSVKEAYAMEVSPPGFKGTVKAMKKHKDIDNPYALAWHMKKKGYKSHKKADGSDKNESVTQGEDMTTLREGEVQQASAIVTAKTMVDRVGRWIEELSGMENETLLQLGDSIRDEMGQEQAKAFIEACAPAIQQALETLKGTRDTLSNGVRSLATGEQPADMLGAEPAEGGEADMAAPAPEAGAEMPAEEPMGDEFAAAEPAAGGAEAPGREQRESIQFQSRLLKVLAG